MTDVSPELVRGAGTTAVLSLLETREMYGYELAEALDRTTEGVLALGQSTLYPMLYSLEAKGLIQATRRTPGRGRPRKYYGLTEEGRTFLARRREEWTGLMGALERLGVLPEPGRQ